MRPDAVPARCRAAVLCAHNHCLRPIRLGDGGTIAAFRPVCAHSGPTPRVDRVLCKTNGGLGISSTSGSKGVYLKIYDNHFAIDTTASGADEGKLKLKLHPENSCLFSTGTGLFVSSN